MDPPFFITFWIAWMVLLFLGGLYAYFAYNLIGRVRNFEDSQGLVQARQLLLIVIPLYVLSFVLVLLYGIYLFFVGWNTLHVQFLFFSVVVLLIFILSVVSFSLLWHTLLQIGRSSKHASEKRVRLAKTDVTISFLSAGTIAFALLILYFGVLYRRQEQHLLCTSTYGMEWSWDRILHPCAIYR